MRLEDFDHDSCDAAEFPGLGAPVPGAECEGCGRDLARGRETERGWCDGCESERNWELAEEQRESIGRGLGGW